ncbi:MAG TPA: hypothetical protein VMC07_00165 [Candidatus Omnitrophota bacterium]|nr:hypothetical protein [Candidatus Omnitrophota bacterium]
MNEKENAKQFMSRMYQALADEYKFQGICYRDLCFTLAILVGKKLLLEDKLPHIEQIVMSDARTRPLIPVRYNNVRWSTHYVCICNQSAWDPTLGKPEPVSSYAQKLLGEYLPLLPFWTTEQLKEFNPTKIFVNFD